MSLAPERVRKIAWILALLVPVVFFAVGLATLKSVPETWDEQFDQDIGRFYVHDWGRLGVEGLKQRFIPLQRNYGPFFDIVIVATRDLVSGKMKWIEETVPSYHFPVLLVSTLGLFLLAGFGRRLFGPVEAFLAVLTLATMPQFIAHSQNNLKDTPLMVFFLASLWLLWEAAERGRWWLWAAAGVVVGLTYAIKLHAAFLAPVVILWQYELHRRDGRRWKVLVPGLLLSGATAFGTILLAWPYYRHQPLARFIETYETFRHHWYNELVFYLGVHYPSHDVPWHFPFVMLDVNTPLVPLAFFVLGLLLAARAFLRKRADRSPLVLLGLWFFVPLVIQIFSGSIKLDGVRHYLLVLPAMALLAAHAMVRAGAWLSARGAWGPRLVAAYAAGLAISFGLVVRTSVALHPYEIAFFNRLTGGTAGAREKFELDYWGVSFTEATRWMNQNCPPGSRVWLTVPGLHFFRIERSRLHVVPDLKRRPNYKVNLIRGLTKTYDTEEDYLHPGRKPVYAVRAGGADLLQIFEYEENRDLPDGAVLHPSAGDIAPGPGGADVQEYADLDFWQKRGAPFAFEEMGFDCAKNPYNDHPVALRLTGSLRVPADDLYDFEIRSDDDAFFFVNDALAIGNGSGVTSKRRFRLEKGVYRLRIDYRNDIGGACLSLKWGRSLDTALRPVAGPDLVRAPAP